jgi:Amt family ammonium transporter
MTMLSIVGTLGILAMVVGFSLLYRDLRGQVSGLDSAWLTFVVAGVSVTLWLIIRLVTPGAWTTSLEAPVAALAGLAAALVSLVVRAQTTRPLPLLVFCLVWTLLVFAPVATAVFFPSSVGLGGADGPIDLGGGLLIGVAAGASALGVLLVARGSSAPSVGTTPMAWWILVTAGALLWVGAIAGYLALEGAIDRQVSPRILGSTLIAPALGIIGWIIGQRIRTSTTSLIGALSGLVSGTVAIAAGAANFTPLWAGATGLIAGLAGAVFASRKTRTRGIGWTLVGAHLLAGAIGLVTTGFFALGIGLIYTGQVVDIQVQFVGALVIGVWSLLVSSLLWLGLRRFALRRFLSRESAGR